MRQRLAAPLRGQRHRVPAGAGPAAIGLLPARRHGDGAVLERRAEAVADGVERRDHVGREPAGLGQHGVDIVGGEFAALRQRGRQPRAVLQREGDIGNRRAVGHGAILVPVPLASTTSCVNVSMVSPDGPGYAVRHIARRKPTTVPSACRRRTEMRKLNAGALILVLGLAALTPAKAEDLLVTQYKNDPSGAPTASRWKRASSRRPASTSPASSPAPAAAVRCATPWRPTSATATSPPLR